VLHKIVGAQFPNKVAKIDGKADAGQNRHLKKAQALENGSQRPHCPHKTQGHPQRAIPLAERRTFMGRARHGQCQHPDKQRGNDRQRHNVEGAEQLQHEFRPLRAAQCLAPGVPTLAQEGVQKLFAGVAFEQHFGSCRYVRGYGH